MTDPENTTDIKEDYPVLERDLVDRTGISKQILREMRNGKLKKGADWGYRDRWIAYTDAAAARLMAEAGMASEKTPAETVQDGAYRAQLEELVVWRTIDHGIVNKRILEAQKPDDEPGDWNTIVRVVVPDSTNFVRGMTFHARKLQNGLYELWDAKRNCPGVVPRTRGRW